MARIQPVDPALLRYARSLRSSATDAETRLWLLARNRRIAGFKFRRQHPFGFHILDFYCRAARLAIELGGEQHGVDPQRARDERRTAYLRDRGLIELRFSNREVLTETGRVLEHIWHTLMQRAGAE